MNKIAKYNTAIYLRLSRDDDDVDGINKNESNSIQSQRALIHSYIQQQDNMAIYDVYIDDGYSGTNFDRPEFKRMMQAIEAFYVNCVIVKDLSRLGRDYIEVGRLIQRTFPTFCVRFISISDHYDSLTANHSDTSLVIPVKNFINDSYCRDISQKVKSHQKIKREKGEFIGSFAVYGYQKDRGNKYKLVPDPYAAKVVKDIFAWKIEGMSSHAIANKLNCAGILSPLEYKKHLGEKYATSFGKSSMAKWSAVAVKRILVNETYIGTLVQGKEEKVSYKIKKSIQKPEHEWIRVENAHEPIIKKQDYSLVNQLLQVDIRASNGKHKAHMFSGLLYCGDCGKKMIRRKQYRRVTDKKDKVSFLCQTKNKGIGCSGHRIGEEGLANAILCCMNIFFKFYTGDKEALVKERAIEVDSVVDEQLAKGQQYYIALSEQLNKDFKEGLLSEEELKYFSSIYESRYKEKQRMLKNQQKHHLYSIQKSSAAHRRLVQLFQEKELSELERVVLMTFIEQIVIFENKRLRIVFRFFNPFCTEMMAT